MAKINKILFVVCMIIGVICMFIPNNDIDDDEYVCNHNFSEMWTHNETMHWHQCMYAGCEAVSDSATHSFYIRKDWLGNDYEYIINGSTYNQYICSYCGYSKQVFVSSSNEGEDTTDYPVDSISILETSIVIDLHTESPFKSLTATISPSYATNKTITWTSSNEAVATVDSNGSVEAKSVGTATITATSHNGKTDTCLVNVVDSEPIYNVTYYNISYLGVVNHNPTSRTENQRIILLNPIRQGYDFMGWYEEDSHTTQVSEIEAGTTEDVVLYAKWEKVFETQGGTITGLTTYGKSKSSITVPSTIDDTRIIQIGRQAFDGSSVNVLTIEEGVIAIRESVFANCSSLRTVRLPESLTSIGNNAFENCENISEIVIKDRVLTMGNDVFKGCYNLIIYSEFSAEPDTWNDGWNPNGCLVFWYSETNPTTIGNYWKYNGYSKEIW